MMSEDKLDTATAQGKVDEGSPAPRKKRNKLAIVGVVVVVLAVVGIGMFVWHEQPSFCSTVCHIEDTYVSNYMQEQGKAGTDKYGNAVSNTNAIMSVLHRNTKATAKPEILCVDCHVPNYFELAHDGLNYVQGNYTMPREERTLARMKSWDEEPGETFCANENCHVYLLGDDGLISYDKLEASTKSRAFNPHEQYHENLSLDCSACHKGHRASTVVCSGCHEHENIELPDGWVTYKESEAIMKEAFAAPTAA